MMFKERINMDIHKILDQIDEIIYISDLDTDELLYLNRAGRLQFGEAVAGVKCYQHFHGATKRCAFCRNGQMQKGQGEQYTWVSENPDMGNVLLHDSVIDYDGRPCRMEIAINIDCYVAELKATQNDLAAAKKLVAGIEKLVTNEDFNASVHFMLEMSMEFYHADRSYIYEFDWEKNLIRNTYEICREGVTPQIDNLQSLPIEVVAFWVDVFKNQDNKAIIIEDVEALKDDPTRYIEYDCLHPQRIQSLIAIPIFIGDKLFGFFAIDNPRVHTDELELLIQANYIAANEFSKRQLTQALINKSYYDPLTDLKNRLAYDEALERLLGKELPTGVGFLDINNLKWINDNLGHDMGNKIIRKLCAILRAHFPEDSLYRISGDEFVIIWSDVEYAAFMKAIEELETALVTEQEIAAFGYIWGREEDVSIAVRKAERAMQRVKTKFYAAHTEARGQRPDYLDAMLQEFRKSRFIPYLQPLYSIKSDKVYGAEVLVRKIDPQGNIHVPVEFIGIMEREHMISMVDFTMLQQTCELIRKWETTWPDIVLNVNFSRSTLAEPGFLERLDKVMAETGVNPAQLVFEITESSQGIQLESLSYLLTEIKQRGIKVAIDDFGTEASCLVMLYLSQISIAKIDRSLICRAEHSEREQLVIRRLIGLCHELGMLCVAEGIETGSQIELLKKLGCDRLQGYKIGKPMPVEEFHRTFSH